MSQDITSHSYDISVESCTGHLINVVLCIPEPEPDGQVLTLPSWIPGSYMIRNFARHIVSLTAHTLSGNDLNVKKTDKQTWQLQPCSEGVEVRYQVYAFDRSVRSAWLDDEFCFFNGTSLCLQVVGQDNTPCTMTLNKPDIPQAAHWRVATSLEEAGQTARYGFGQYRAENYDELIDHPVLFGEFDVEIFTVDNVQFELVFAGGHQSDMRRICDDLSKICQHHLRFFEGPAPVERYLFITMLSDNSFGGLEHRSSTALMYSRNDLPASHEQGKISSGYQTFLSLCSHELWHTWHVKRIQPDVLKAADLRQEAYTEQLWIYEGFTSYYDDLTLVRCGLISAEKYLQIMGENLTRLLRNPGRFKQSVTASSFDAWTRFYLQDASSVNHIVSYYNKGAVIALCLDLTIRQVSDNRLSLDNVMDVLWREFGTTGKATQIDSIQMILKNHFQLDLDDDIHQFIYGTGEIPVMPLLSESGVTLHFRPRSGSDDKGGKPADNVIRIDFGASFKDGGTGVVLTQIPEGTTAYESGLMIGDKLIAIDGWQVCKSTLPAVLDRCDTGSRVPLTVLRDRRLKTLSFPVRLAREDTVYLSISDEAAVASWLTGNESDT